MNIENASPPAASTQRPDAIERGLLRLVHSSSLGILVLDARNVVTACNSAAARLFALGTQDLLERAFPSIDTSLDHSLRAVLDEARRGISVEHRELIGRRDNGMPFVVRISVTAAEPESLVPSALIVIAEDVTEQALAHEALQESEARLRAIFDASVDAIIVYDELGIIESCNPACERIFGYARDEILGANVGMLMPESVWLQQTRYSAAPGDTVVRRVVATGTEVLAQHKNGGLLQVELSVTEMMTASGHRFAGTMRDVSMRKRVEESARRLNEELKNTITELEDVNRQNRVLSEMRDLLQTCHSVDEVYQVTRQFVPKLVSGAQGALYMLDTRNELLEAVVGWGDRSLQEVVFVPDACWALRRGRSFLVTEPAEGLCCKHLPRPPEQGYVCVPLTAQGDTLGLLHLQADTGSSPADAHTGERMERLVATLTEHVSLAVANVRLRDSLRVQATKDALTGLYNRRFMEDVLERELRRAVRKKRQLAVFMVDIDHFKRINDVFGHEIGDFVLREVASALRANIRQEDYACRYGGEEFVLVLPESDLDAVMPRAETILQAVRRLAITQHGQSIGQVTVSIGVAAYPQHGLSVPELVRTADQALYRAKHEGRNRVVSASAPQTVESSGAAS
jgi:diguanylate cyclase (GGDEF)-like protein/PAS domain S-box-containing protein